MTHTYTPAPPAELSDPERDLAWDWADRDAYRDALHGAAPVAYIVAAALLLLVGVMAGLVLSAWAGWLP